MINRIFSRSSFSVTKPSLLYQEFGEVRISKYFPRETRTGWWPRNVYPGVRISKSSGRARPTEMAARGWKPARGRHGDFVYQRRMKKK